MCSLEVTLIPRKTFKKQTHISETRTVSLISSTDLFTALNALEKITSSHFRPMTEISLRVMTSLERRQ